MSVFLTSPPHFILTFEKIIGYFNMKKLVSLISGWLLMAATVAAGAKESPVVFDSYEWDFGTVNGAAGAICHTFVLTNR